MERLRHMPPLNLEKLLSADANKLVDEVLKKLGQG
jgi:hypothetical protein